MTISGKQRAALRADAHHLDATLQVGQLGITDTFTQALDDALRARELVKVHLGRGAELSVREAAAMLSEATGSDVVQVIGRTASFYRHNPELQRDADGRPLPSRRRAR